MAENQNPQQSLSPEEMAEKRRLLEERRAAYLAKMKEEVAQKAKPGNPRLSDALSEATDAFFKNVFEKQHKTAEEFAQDLLFALLAFPLETLNVYLTKKYDKSEKGLLKEILAEMQKNNQSNKPSVSSTQKEPRGQMPKSNIPSQKLMTVMHQKNMLKAA